MYIYVLCCILSSTKKAGSLKHVMLIELEGVHSNVTNAECRIKTILEGFSSDVQD